MASTGDAAVPGCSGSRPAVFIPLYPTFLLPDMQSPGATAASQPLLIAGARFPYDGALPFSVSLSIVSVRETSLFWFIALASLSFRKPHVSRLDCNCYLAIGYQIPTDIYASGFFCAICASSKELLENPTFKQIHPSLCNI